MDPSMGGVGEVRRVHVIYFLSRNGLIEQPHLIRVHHLHRSGVHLRDVKRWLSDLRGKDMPESFAWSYKRRYKAGCVWQDLTDDDLITPISDNEYVLKGSELPHNHNNPLFETFSTSDGSHIEEPEGDIEKTPELKLAQETLPVDQPDDSSSQTPPPRLHEELPGAAHTPRPLLRRQHEEEEEEESEGEKKLLPDVEEQEEYSYSFEEKSTSTSSHASSRRASHVFRNLLGCKASTANDSALRAGGRKDGGLPVSGNVSSRSLSHRRVVDGCSSSQRFSAMPPKLSSNSRRSRSRKMGERTISTIHKPVGKPNCSQCGKAFKPAKFYSHMKSCEGLKGSMREAEST